MDWMIFSGTAAFVLNLIAVIIAIYKLGRAVEKFEQIGTQQANEIKDLKETTKKIGDLITRVAVSTQRQDTFAEQLMQMRREIDDFRRGEGFILPIAPKP